MARSALRQELLMRRIAEAWVEGQRRAYQYRGALSEGALDRLNYPDGWKMLWLFSELSDPDIGNG